LAGANSLKGQHHVAAQINFPDYSPEGKSAWKRNVLPNTLLLPCKNCHKVDWIRKYVQYRTINY
jgi:hypothetical protein